MGLNSSTKIPIVKSNLPPGLRRYFRYMNTDISYLEPRLVLDDITYKMIQYNYVLSCLLVKDVSISPIVANISQDDKPKAITKARLKYYAACDIFYKFYATRTVSNTKYRYFPVISKSITKKN